MSAGMSNKQLYSAIYRKLHKIQRQLIAKGYLCHYHNKALYTGTQFHEKDRVAWYLVNRASNGETCALFQAINEVRDILKKE